MYTRNALKINSDMQRALFHARKRVEMTFSVELSMSLINELNQRVTRPMGDSLDMLELRLRDQAGLPCYRI